LVLPKISNNQEIFIYVFNEKIFSFFENNSSRSVGLWKVVTPEDLPESAGPGRVEKKEEEDILPFKPLSGCITTERVNDSQGG
jgi:hypothetical protein